MNASLINDLKDSYHSLFGLTGKETYVFSPGRINLLGEHVDYNDGIVLPAAIHLGIYMIAERRKDQMICLYSAEFDETVTLDLANPIIKSDSSWANYLIGVIAQFQEKGIVIPGINLVFNGDIPIGSGLSSSAALECGVAFIVNHLSGAALNRTEMALMAQKAEHEYAGVQCGIMDQMASILGRKDQVIQLDTQSLEFKYSSLNLDTYGLVLIDSRVNHSLASSQYNVRRSQSSSVLEELKSSFGVKSFRECTLEMLDKCSERIEADALKRGRYVIKEIARVEAMIDAMNESNLDQIGNLMNETHVGLSQEYEVSCKELDFLHEEANKYSQVIGARMMGGGFGGCTLNLIEKDFILDITEKISRAYESMFNIKPKTIPVHLSDGTTLINLKEST